MGDDRTFRRAPTRFSSVLWVILPVTFAAFLYSLFSGFHGDDFPLIETASRTTPVGAFLERIDVYYRPIVWSTFAFEHALWGSSSIGYHFTNILIHVVNTALAVFITREIIPHRRIAMVVGLYFGLTPTHAGSVIFLFARTDLLCATFYFAALLTFVGFVKRGMHGLALAAALATILALLCKEMALSLPIVAIVIAFAYSNGNLAVRCVASLRKASPVIGALVIYLLVRFLFVDGLPRSPMHDHWTFTKLAVNLARYAITLVFPLSLELVKPFFRAHTWVLLLCSGLLLLLAGAAATTLRRSKAALPVILCTLIAISPVIRLYGSWYLYIPSFGVAVLLGLLVDIVPGKVGQIVLIQFLTAAGVVIHLAGLAQTQLAVRTSGDLVSECIEALARTVSSDGIAIVTAVPTEYRGVPTFGWIYNLRYGLKVSGHDVHSIPLVGVRASSRDVTVESKVLDGGRLDIRIRAGQGFFRIPNLEVIQGSRSMQPGDRLKTDDAMLEVKAVDTGGQPIALIVEPSSFSFSDPRVRLFTLLRGRLKEVLLSRKTQS